MNTVNVRNAVYSALDKSTIDCELEHPVYGWIPFTASREDVEEFGREVFAALTTGAAGRIGPYVDPATLPV